VAFAHTIQLPGLLLNIVFHSEWVQPFVFGLNFALISSPTPLRAVTRSYGVCDFFSRVIFHRAPMRSFVLRNERVQVFAA